MRKYPNQAKIKAEKYLPSFKIRKHIIEKTNEVFELNDGHLDKQSFMLGMSSMWIYCVKNELFK